MALALLVFCMTTLWPVTYLYLDVWVFLVGAFACRVCPPPARLAPIAAAGAIVSSFMLVLLSSQELRC